MALFEMGYSNFELIPRDTMGTRTRNQDHAVEVGAGGTVTTQATTTGGPSVGVSDPTPEAKASLLVPCSAGSSFISGR